MKKILCLLLLIWFALLASAAEGPKRMFLTPANPLVPLVNGSQKFSTVLGSFEGDIPAPGGGVIPASGITWLSNNPAVATIDSTGLATLHGGGIATITAVYRQFTGSTKLTVLVSGVKSIAVMPASLTIPQYSSQPYTATATLNNNSTVNATNSVQWSSSAPTTASISNGPASFGVVYGAAIGGPVTITATYGTVNGTATVNVVAALISINVSAASQAYCSTLNSGPAPCANIYVEDTDQFTATGNYSDGSTKNLTGSVVWTAMGCNPSGAATIFTAPNTNAGLATGVSVGTCTITATLGAIKGQELLNINPLPTEVVYVATGGTLVPNFNPLAGTISAYKMGATGALTAVTNSTALPTSDNGELVAPWIAVHPNGKFAYVVNVAPNENLPPPPGFVSVFSINSTTGALTKLASTFATGVLPDSIVIDPTGSCAYVANLNYVHGMPVTAGSISAYTINTNTGVLTPLATSYGTELSPGSVTVDGTGKYVFAANANSDSISGYAIQATSGNNACALTSIGQSFLSTGTNSFYAHPAPAAIAASAATPYIFVAENRTNQITSLINQSGFLNPSIGGNLLNSNFTTDDRPVALALDPHGKYLYAAIYNPNGKSGVDVFKIGASGGLTQVGALVAADMAPVSLRVDPLGRFLYVANDDSDDVSIFKINSDGSLTAEGSQSNTGGPIAIAIWQAGLVSF